MGTEDWVIRKSGYFYRPNRSGYTQNIAEAGRFTEKFARDEAAIEPHRMSGSSHFRICRGAGITQGHDRRGIRRSSDCLDGTGCRDVDGFGGVGVRYLGAYQ